MCSRMLSELVKMSQTPEAQEQTVEYLGSKLKALVKPGDRAILCFQNQKRGGLGDLYERAVRRAGGDVVLLSPDKRWKSLLQQSFFSHASLIIGPPLVILGLAKLKKHSGLPLYTRNAVLAGYLSPEWIVEGIQQGLDCKVWGTFGLGTSSVVAGFACGNGMAIHVRSDIYGIHVMDRAGSVLPQEHVGELVLYPISAPEIRVFTGDIGRLEKTQCVCGCDETRLMDYYPGNSEDTELAELAQQLQSWTSVLDCRVRRSEQGLEIELVVFPGEKLPKLPSVAKQVVRPWDPKHDEPFFFKPLPLV